jgi:hypothetical protein
MRLDHIKTSAIAGLLGAALLLGSPLPTNAEPGKGRGNGNGKGWRSEVREERGEGRGKRERGNGKVSRSVERRREERVVRRSAPSRGGERTVKRSSSRKSDERVVRSEGRSAPRSEDRVTRRAKGWNGGGSGVRTGRVREGRAHDGGSVVRSGGRTTVERQYSYRAPSRTRVQTSYRAPRWSGGRYYTGARYHTAYRGYPVYREYVSYRYTPAYAPAYGWRYYCAPRYHYPTHVIYVQPVRFFVAADFVIGGVGISARYVDPGPVYGCNFCDARFGDYYAYERHVEGYCGDAPHGYRIHAEDWDDEVWDHGHDDDGYEEELD